MQYIKRALLNEARQWDKHGDHDAVKHLPDNIVKKYGKSCGWIPIAEGGFIVGPGDWIVEDGRGSYWPVPDHIFKSEYYSYDPTEQLDKQQLQIIRSIEKRHWILEE